MANNRTHLFLIYSHIEKCFGTLSLITKQWTLITLATNSSTKCSNTNMPQTTLFTKIQRYFIYCNSTEFFDHLRHSSPNILENSTLNGHRHKSIVNVFSRNASLSRTMDCENATIPSAGRPTHPLVTLSIPTNPATTCSFDNPPMPTMQGTPSGVVVLPPSKTWSVSLTSLPVNGSGKQHAS